MNEGLINIVRANLRSRGYRVKTLAGTGLGFDLLVGGKHRVLVMKHVAGGVCISDDQAPFDTCALVSFDAAKRPVILYTNAGEPSPDPRVVFGLSTSSKGKYGEGKKGKGKAAAKKGGKKAIGTHG